MVDQKLSIFRKNKLHCLVELGELIPNIGSLASYDNFVAEKIGRSLGIDFWKNGQRQSCRAQQI